jgi:hypothetical protein
MVLSQDFQSPKYPNKIILIGQKSGPLDIVAKIEHKVNKQEASMTRSEEVIERSMALVASLRAQRERDMQRRAEWQKRVELRRVLPPLPRPVQLSLALKQ